MNPSQSFPLFESLDKNIPKKDLTVKQKEEYNTKVSELDTSGKELVYALIMVFYINTEETPLVDILPYKGKLVNDQHGNSDISWVFSDFPIRLRHILYKFIMLHNKKMNEESNYN
jgi:hypothetical protein